MDADIKNALGILLPGLFIDGVGLVFAANLFGVARQHASYDSAERMCIAVISTTAVQQPS